MAVIIDSSGRLHHDQDRGLALSCPHCHVLAHITPVSVPDFNQLQLYKPSQVGVVYRCEACNAPIFLKFPVKVYAGSRVELSPSFVELERPREKFSFTHLPEEVETLFKEALACFSSGCYNAFASMCRRTAQAVFADLGEAGKLELYDELASIRRMAGPRIDLRADVNMGWSVSQALGKMPALAREGVRSFEQPLAADDFEGAARLVSETGLDRLARLPLYFKAISERVRKLEENPGRDREASQELAKALSLFESAGGAIPTPLGSGESLQQVRWLLEELRISLFAQSLGTSESVSVQRIKKVLVP